MAERARLVSKAYRSRAVREPRKVLREFGLTVPESVEVQVHDSNADLRYIVLPPRPAGTGGLNEEPLAALLSRDCLVGAALPRRSSGT
ncbi:MAG TPA: nitrile hydratase subunit alpha [Xanthobacteraceae bacterium]|jgi:nitrile hydratase